MVNKKTTTKKPTTGTSEEMSESVDAAEVEGLPPFFDPRAMEGMMTRMARLLDEQEFATIEEANAFLQQFVGTKDLPQTKGELTSLERAQEIMYEAWGTEDEARRVELAREALSVSPDCADAYVLLAEETTDSIEEARRLYEQGVSAGERALGEERLTEEAGHFWGETDTRPYMRAREGLAQCLLEGGEVEEAIKQYQELLRLNPNDNQGVRYTLALELFAAHRDDELALLLERYKDDAAAIWIYTRALLKYRQEGEGVAANRLLQEAFDGNPFVPLVLLTMMASETPPEPPDYIGLGDETEALDYIMRGIGGWLETPGAMDWFGEQMRHFLDNEKPSPTRRRKPRAKKRKKI